MNKIKILNLTLSLFLAAGAMAQAREHSAERRPFAKLISDEEKGLLKEIRRNVRETMKEGGESLREIVQENGLGRQKPTREKSQARAKAYFSKSEEERIRLLNKTLEVSERFSQAEEEEDKVVILAELIPLLKSLPPPRKGHRSGRAKES
jgi:hypothetical protein